MNEENENKIMRFVVRGFIALSVVAIIIFIVRTIDRIGKNEIYVGYAPFVAEVTLNGKKVQNNATNYLADGEYELVVSYNGFKTKTEKISINASTKEIIGSISPNSEEGERIYKEHAKDYSVIESHYAEQLIDEANANQQKWPIMGVLPESTPQYKIGYITENENITITIQSASSYMDYAVKNLKNKIVDIDNIEKYRIRFSGFENELEDNFQDNDSIDIEEYVYDGYEEVDDVNITGTIMDGDYAIVKLTTGTEETYTLMTYRMIIKKGDKGWERVSGSWPILTVYNTDDVPEEIIREANKL